MIAVGLTGGIACGKSTVAAILRARGVPVLDLDQVARDIVAPGTPALAEIAARWPAMVRDGALDRKALGAIVFADPEARRALEAITHPRVWDASERWLAERRAEGHPIAVVEAALMVETGSWRRYDRLLVVSCSPDVQLARVRGRDGLTEAQARARIEAQLPMAGKERVATVVVRNDADEAALQAQVERAWGRVGTA